MQQDDRTDADALPPIRDKALAYLARRDHTKMELSRKLLHAGYPQDSVAAVLDELSQRGWLSDRRFAENFVSQRKTRYGSLKLAHELRQRGLDESDASQALEAARETELDRAKEIWRKKFGTLPADAAEKARQIRFLQNRGFSGEVIQRLIRNQN